MSGNAADLDDSVLDAFADTAREMAAASRPIITRHFRQPLTIDRKADRTLVTQADLEAETAMREIVARRFPDHGIVGEEFGAQGGDREFVWVIDPLDGTHAFIAGLPTFGTLIALCRHGVPVLGVIDQVALDERWVGVAGRPTSYEGHGEAARIAGTRPCSSLDAAILYATAPGMFEGQAAQAFAAVGEAVSILRFGTDCYAYALVAAGHGDLVVEANMKIYDYLALVPVIEGAGGVITDWQGAPLTMTSGGLVLAAGDRRIHAQAQAILATGISR